MPKRCNCYGCFGNYPHEPYTKVVSFPKDPNERERWILAMPNEPNRLRSLKQIYICESHFDCDWTTCKGGKRPTQPPSVFKDIPKTCLKQSKLKPRPTSSCTADARRVKELKKAEILDKIQNFETFCTEMRLRYPQFPFCIENEKFYMSATDKIGQKVELFIHFKHVESAFGVLLLQAAEKHGINSSKNLFPLQKIVLYQNGLRLNQ